MINLKLIYKVLGSLLFIEAFLMLVCLSVSFYYDEDDLFAFSVSIILTLIGAFTLRYYGREAGNNLSRRDAYLVVTLAWTAFSLFGALPFFVGAYITDFTDAFFEAMSGFTTTGATVFDDVESLPRGLLFWRSLTQWVGGLGIVFFMIAVLPSMTGGSVKVFAAEATGPVKSKMHPRLSASAKWIWSIYALLTIICICAYWLLGMSPFDAVNYAMTTTATGGFATHNASVSFFNSPALEYVSTFFCFLAGINFILLYSVVTRFNIKRLWHSSEFRLYFFLIVIFSAYVMAELIFRNGYAIEHALRSALFTVVSFITTTGLFNDDAALWPRHTWIVLAICMFIGGMSGSTSGGMKCIRGVMLYKMLKNEFRQMLHPNAVLPLNVDGYNISQQKRSSLMSLLMIYLLLFVVASFFLTCLNIDATNSVTIIMSCLGNVGPTLGTEIGPTMSWAELPDAAKWVCSFYMLMGRLEIFTVLVIFAPNYWNEN
ncbi:MAG: TrkH family potassium uptake protein [Prevotella sp.]|nr:TrkH family potassium uptake protein [Prevotella sp.]